MDRLEEIQGVIDASGAECVAVANQALDGSRPLLINADVSMHAASTMKICVMMELFRQIDEGRFKLDDEVVVNNSFKSLADGSNYSVTAEDDSDETLYKQIGRPVSLRELTELMITHSANLATNVLIELLLAENVSDFMAKLGAPTLKVKRGVEDKRAYRLGINNEVTAQGLLTILIKLAKGEVVSRQASTEMIEVMFRQKHRNGIPAKLPPDLKVANKTGWNEGICHDAAIIYRPNSAPCALVVLTRGLKEVRDGEALIANISSALLKGLLPQPRQ